MIGIEKISKTFGHGTPNRVRALDSISIAIAAHEFVIVIGTNGSGKSTLLNAIAGSFFPDSGRIVIDGTDVTRMDVHRRAGFIGRVFQNPFIGTAPTMTVAENLRLGMLRGKRKGFSIGLTHSAVESFRERASELGMDLENRMETPIGLLSGGQRQALTLLMATIREPRILLLDEHTSALDPRSAELILSLTERLVSRSGLTTLMVTHDMDEATRLGSRLVMMHEGRIVTDIAGEEKAAMTPAMLLEKFGDLRKVALQ